VEQLHNPSLSSGHLLLSRGVTHLLRGELPEAQSDFAQAQKSENGVTGDALAGQIVAEELSGQKAEVDTLWTYVISYFHPFSVTHFFCQPSPNRISQPSVSYLHLSKGS